MKKVKKKIGILSLLFFLITSCQKEDLGNLSNVLYVRHKGADMPAYIYGNASEKVFLILLHGGPGGNSMTYRTGTFKSEIEKECAVVYFDQRGSGMSAGNYSKGGINVDIMAEDVRALTDVIHHKYGNESRFFLMGHSWGGTLGTATLLAGDNQNQFKGWIEVDGGHELKQLYFENISYFRQVGAEQIAMGNNVDYWSGVLSKISQVDTMQFNEDDSDYMNSEAFKAEEKLTEDGIIQEIDGKTAIDAIGALFKNNLLTTFWNSVHTNSILSEDQNIFEAISYTDRLDEITIPSLVLWGRYDMVIPPKQGQEAFDNLGSQNKELVIFEKSGHSPMDNEGEKFALEVIEFINEFK